ncbi:uncharacterized protein [Ranitomeya imitator]|uniref:uncharacterized protein isoform X1 n=1 Tax=Ranitomeya imitator TaxID=111125 RepID=UPI0037E82137
MLPYSSTQLSERMHLSRGVRTHKGLQKQVNAYLACLTCLQLIRPEYSRIVQPASGAVGKKCIVTGVFLSRGGFSSQAFTLREKLSEKLNHYFQKLGDSTSHLLHWRSKRRYVLHGFPLYICI